MVTVCWAAKGGSGTTVVSCVLALSSRRPSLLVDLAGDAPAVLGVSEPGRPGVGDWLQSAAASEQLAELAIPLGERRMLLPWRASTSNGALDGAPRWDELGRWLRMWSDREAGEVVIDAGTGDPPGELLGHADSVLLVTRSCYLALRQAVRCTTRPTGIVLVDEPGRALRERDVEHAIGATIEATVSYDPAIARAVDSGLLASRLPRVIRHELRRVA
jgi:hypothetical protein